VGAVATVTVVTEAVVAGMMVTMMIMMEAAVKTVAIVATAMMAAATAMTAAAAVDIMRMEDRSHGDDGGCGGKNGSHCGDGEDHGMIQIVN
jgi:hypothetical protein